MKLEAVIFEMDGVLIDTNQYHYLSWKQVMQQLGRSFTRRDHDKLYGLSSRQILDILLGALQLSEAEICELLEYKNSCFMSYLDRIGTQDLLPGVFELLWELHAAQIPVDVSSLDINAHLIISKLGINYHIEAICDGNNVEKLKPDADLFLSTASMLGVEPEDCTVIEGGEAGIQAGLSARMCVVGVGLEQRIHQAHAVFHSLENVRLIDLKNIYAAWHAESVVGEIHEMEKPQLTESLR
jgi:beta-phosphoglucomutase